MTPTDDACRDTVESFSDTDFHGTFPLDKWTLG